MSRGVWVLITVGLLIDLAGLALGPATSGVNSIIGTAAFRHEIEAKASQAAGGNVEISQITFSFIHGVRLGGLTSKIVAPQGTVVSQVESVDCSFSWLALLERRLKFNHVNLVQPQIVLTQEPPASVPQPIAPASPAADGGKPVGPAPASSFDLERAAMSDGSLSIRDASGATKADLKGVTVHADTSGYNARKEVTGTLAITTIALPQNLGLSDFAAPFTYHSGAVDADPLSASAFGGKLSGGYHLPAGGAASALEIDGTDLDVAKIGQTAKPGAASPLSGALSLQSHWRGVETGTLSGEGDAQIANGRLSGIAALHEIAGVLRVPALADPELTSVKVHFQIEGGVTRFSGLQIESPVFEITGDGVIDPQGALNASLNLRLHGGAMGGLTGLAASLVSRAGSIPLHLSGSVSDPHTNLSAGMLNPAPVGKTVDRALNRFFH